MGKHRAPNEHGMALVLLVCALTALLAIGALALTARAMNVVQDRIARLPALQPPSPTPEAWIDKLHTRLEK